jgi:hypothetical protein
MPQEEGLADVPRCVLCVLGVLCVLHACACVLLLCVSRLVGLIVLVCACMARRQGVESDLEDLNVSSETESTAERLSDDGEDDEEERGVSDTAGGQISSEEEGETVVRVASKEARESVSTPAERG